MTDDYTGEMIESNQRFTNQQLAKILLFHIGCTNRHDIDALKYADDAVISSWLTRILICDDTENS